ncbi:MAG: hypothetical protein R3215_10425 [Halomonas sp.]|nr:hypothetical protein [Halomonas sp.]
MSYQQAINELNDQFAQGDIDADVYAEERQRIEYEHGEQQSAMDDRRVTA